MQRHAHDRPDLDELGVLLGNQVVEGAPYGGQIGLNPADPRWFGYASASAAVRSASASSVRSQVKLGSRRPKCPYAAVFW
jgi:hypothetical protein